MSTEVVDDQGLAEMEALVGQPLTKTLLEIWWRVLGEADDIMRQPIGPEWADAVGRLHPRLDYRDLPQYVDFYMEYHNGMLDILKWIVGNDTERGRIFSRQKEDAKRNAHHYLNLLLLWQQQVSVWEREWKPTDEDAVVRAAALLDVLGTIFGNARREGLAAHLNHPLYAEILEERPWLDELLREWQKEEL